MAGTDEILVSAVFGHTALRLSEHVSVHRRPWAAGFRARGV